MSDGSDDREQTSRTRTAGGSRLSRRTTVAALAVALLVAAYTGFRIPNAWSATLESVSVFAGFHKRFVVGTLLHPLALATGYSYWLFAGWAFLVLGAILAVLVRAAMRTDLVARRLLIVAWLLLPTGGFLFDEVGYLDQDLYLLLFASLWLLGRRRLAAATAVMAVAPLIHEIAILTVIPIFGLVALRELPWRRAVAITAVPAAVDLVALAMPAAAPGAPARMSATLRAAGMPFRVDALSLFERSQGASWKLYDLHTLVLYMTPLALILVALFLWLCAADRGDWRGGRGAAPAAAVVAASCLAIAAPALLMFGGWDGNRWVFLMLANFFLVAWLSIGGRRARELGAHAIAVIVVACLVIGHIPIWYFDGYAPRELGTKPVWSFVHQIVKGSLFAPPKD
jgi:hypothetical protein